MKQWAYALVLLSLTAPAVWADLEAGSNTAAIFGGLGGSGAKYDYQPGTEKPVSGSGGAYGGQFLHYWKGSPAWAFGVDIADAQNGDSHAEDLLAGIDTTARTQTLVGLAIVRLSYPKGVIRPYLFGGLGGYHASQKLTGHPHAGSTWTGGGSETRTFVDESKNSLALGIGIGLDIFVTETFFFGPELRGAMLAGLDTDDTPALKSAGYNVHNTNGIGQGYILLRAGVKF